MPGFSFDLSSELSDLSKNYQGQVKGVQDLATSSFSDIRNNYSFLASLVPEGNFPMDGRGKISPDGAYKYGVAALGNFSKATGMSVSTDLMKFVASAGAGGGLDFRNPDIAALGSVLSQISGVNLIKEADSLIKPFAKIAGNPVVSGVAGIGTTLVGGLSDGNFGSDDFAALAQSVGAFATSVIGSTAALGACAGPIGAAVGAVVGILISLFTPRPPPPPVLSEHYSALHALNAQAQANFDAYATQRAEFVRSCSNQESEYWSAFDEFFKDFADKWAQAEMNCGFRFDLRWFEDDAGPAFYAHPTKLRRFGARWGQEYYIDDKAPWVPKGAESYRTTLVKGTPTTTCLTPFAGCPYPAHPVGYPMPKGKIPGYAGKIFSVGDREAKAFAARDLIWVPPEMRLDCNRFMPLPKAAYTYSANEQGYIGTLQGKSKELALQYAHFQKAANLLRADLVRTTTIVDKYLYMLSRRDVLAVEGADLNDVAEHTEAYIEGKNRSLNNTALLGGMGVLGYALWRTLR